MEINKEALDNLIKTAQQAGCLEDQVKNFLTAQYVPLTWQWDFHSQAREADKSDGPVEVACGGARGPGKSRAVFSQVALDDCQRFPMLKVLFLRQTAVSAQEAFDDLIEKVLLGKLNYEKKNSTVIFPNGSRILLGGFHDEKDIDKYIGIEYDLIVVEELNQLTEDKLEKLRGSLRSSKIGWRPRLYTSFNPGGVGHSFVKSRYVTPYKISSQTTTRFIPATYRANIFLNKEYTDYLESLKGDLGIAWREGEFDLFAGQYFTEWKYDIHVVQPFEIPKDWTRFMAGDYGFSAPSSIGWYAISPDGDLYRYRELYGTGMGYTKLATEAVSLTDPKEIISYCVFDPAFWSKKGERDDELSGAEVFSSKWKDLTTKDLRMIRANNSRVVGWGVVREYLKVIPKDDGFSSKLKVFKTCTEIIRTLPEQQHDKRNPEDIDSKLEDHACDELRYAVMSRPEYVKVIEYEYVSEEEPLYGSIGL